MATNTTAKYWFARRRLDQPYNRKMGPVSREGWLVVAFFVGCMVVGGIAMIGLASAAACVIFEIGSMVSIYWLAIVTLFTITATPVGRYSKA